jgi:F0F1-type ATP synthase assembly protein I
MLGFMLAHGGDASGLGMLAFVPVGLLLLVGLIIVLRPAMTASALESADEDDDDKRPEADEERR